MLAIQREMRKNRISVQMNADIQEFVGDTKLEGIRFYKSEHSKMRSKMIFDVPQFEIKPDLVIVENGLGRPKIDLSMLVEKKDHGSLLKLRIDDNNKMLKPTTKFSMVQNDISPPLLAAGDCTEYQSFFHKYRVRVDDVKFNIEQGFYAAMAMLDKQVEFNYIPMTYLKIGDKNVHFVGERN